jgi:hypothetical protein
MALMNRCAQSRGGMVRADAHMVGMPSELQQPPEAPQPNRPQKPWGRLSAREAQEQLKEAGILLSLILVRLQMLNYVNVLDTSKSDKTYALKNTLKYIVTENAHYGLYASWSIIALLVLSVLLRRGIPRRWIDIIAGAFISFNLTIHFLKINLLLLTPPGAPSMLLGQIFTYLIFFVIAWGWIFWRFDWVGKENPGTVVEISDKGDSLSTFDYYHASLMALVRRGRPEVSGLNRTGKILVAIHTFMVLDLIGVALGRFYQLITRMI